MADEPDNLVLVMLRKLDAKFDRQGEEIRELKARMMAVEDMFAFLVTAVTRIQHSLERLEARVERIEKRLGLIDEPTI
jgi:predicted nuclease with TOPRIM domain